jgi:hypothetical protein
MTYGLSRTVNFSWGRESWGCLFTIAEAFGWEPEGTTDPCLYQDPSGWPGSYFQNHGQRVSSADALAFADALIRAIDCAVKRDGEVNRTRPLEPPNCFTDPLGLVQKSEADDYPTDVDLDFIRQHTRPVLAFIDFLRGGAFRIY